MKLLNYYKEHPIALLIFSLLSGIAYFCMLLAVLILPMVKASPQMLIVWFFAPVIVCGAALVLVKFVKKQIENEQPRPIVALTILHIGVIAVGIVFAIALFKNVL